MTREKLLQLVEEMYALHADHVSCDDCDAQMDCLAELVAAGYDCSLLAPAIQRHLQCCNHCREEFQGLVKILQAESVSAA
jgi:hypothetical protein